MICLLGQRGCGLLLECKLLAPRGAVAQLGERRVRNAKVGSSILLGSTKTERLSRAVYGSAAPGEKGRRRCKGRGHYGAQQI